MKKKNKRDVLIATKQLICHLYDDIHSIERKRFSMRVENEVFFTNSYVLNIT